MLVFSVNVSISYGRVPPLTAIGDRVLFFLSDNCLFTGIVGSPTLQKYGTEKGDHDGAGKYKDSTSTKSEQLSCQLRMGIDGAVLSLDISGDDTKLPKSDNLPEQSGNQAPSREATTNNTSEDSTSTKSEQLSCQLRMWKY